MLSSKCIFTSVTFVFTTSTMLISMLISVCCVVLCCVVFVGEVIDML